MKSKVFCACLCFLVALLSCFAFWSCGAPLAVAQSVDFSFGMSEAVVLLSGGNFHLTANAASREVGTIEDMNIIWGIEDESLIQFAEPVDKEDISTRYFKPMKAGTTKIWAAAEMQVLVSETYYTVSSRSEITIFVEETIGSLSIVTSNGNLNKTNIAPDEDILATLYVNEKQNLLNMQTVWAVSVDGTEVPFETTNQSGAQILMYSVAKGAYKISATVGGQTEEMSLTVRTDGVYVLLTKLLPFLCLALLVVVTCLSIFKKKKIPLCVCLSQAEFIYERATKYLQKINESKASEKKKNKRIVSYFRALKLLSDDLYYRMYAINLDMLNQCQSLIVKTDALKRVCNTVYENRKNIDFDKKRMVLQRLCDSFLPQLKKAIDITVTAYLHAAEKHDVPQDEFFILAKTKTKKAATRDGTEYLRQFFEMGDDGD